MKNLNYIALLIISIPVSLSIGCGRINASNINYAPANSTAFSGFSPSNKIAASFSCPGVPNVVPNLDETVDGSDYFTVCTSKTIGNFSDLLITGRFSSNNSLCVVPVQMLDPTHFMPKLDAQKNPVYTCSAPTADGVLVSNPSANSASFNSIIIVESPELNNLVRCIQNNFTNCPNYSFGKFR
ncbi:MAG: hypothetical protein ABI041_03105 [Bdellovibrionia bacterium]